MALSKRIRAFSGVVLFLSVLPAAYLIGEMRGAQRTSGTTDETQTHNDSFKLVDRLELPKQLNQAQANPSGSAGAQPPCGWQVGPGNAGLLPNVASPFGGGDPFARMEAEMQAMQQHMDRVFGSAIGGVDVGLGGVGAGGLQVTEDGGNYVVRCPAEGLDEGSLHVGVEDQALTVSGECTRKSGSASYSSSFSQMATLPGPVDVKTLKTDLKDGVLVISIAKAPSSTSRSYSANHGGALLH